jgi:hypothetical protein
LIIKTLLIGVLSWLVVSGAPLPRANAPSIAGNEPIVLFTVYEGAGVNVYSSHLDGSSRTLLLSQELKLMNARPADVINAKISPDSRRIAYKLPGFGNVHGNAPLFLMDANGENKKRIVDEVVHFFWSTESNDIIYSAPLPPPGPMQEQSIHEDGYEWHKINLQTGQDETIAARKQKLHRFVGWIRNDQAIFMSYWLAGTLLYILDLKTRSISEIKVPPRVLLAEVNVSPGRRRILASAADQTHPCIFYDVGVGTKTMKQIAAGKDRCEEIAWNGDNEFFFGVWSDLPEGQTNESGHYALGSVYKYDFKSKAKKSVLASNGKAAYRLQGIVPGKAMIVSNESNRRSPQYILESRDLKGKHPVTLFASEKEMLFLGYLR